MGGSDFFFAKGACANVSDATIAMTAIVNNLFIVVYCGDYFVFSLRRKKSPFIPTRRIGGYLPLSFFFFSTQRLHADIPAQRS